MATAISAPSRLNPSTRIRTPGRMSAMLPGPPPTSIDVVGVTVIVTSRPLVASTTSLAAYSTFVTRPTYAKVPWSCEAADADGDAAGRGWLCTGEATATRASVAHSRLARIIAAGFAR